MVFRMSISSVPGANSVFFASFPIDYLPIDKVWEKVRALGRACQVAWSVLSALRPTRRREISCDVGALRPRGRAEPPGCSDVAARTDRGFQARRDRQL